MKPALLLLNGASIAETFPLEGIESVSVGRAENNQISLSDADVSRRHCSVEERGGAVRPPRRTVMVDG